MSWTQPSGRILEVGKHLEDMERSVKEKCDTGVRNAIFQLFNQKQLQETITDLA